MAAKRRNAASTQTHGSGRAVRCGRCNSALCGDTCARPGFEWSSVALVTASVIAASLGRVATRGQYRARRDGVPFRSGGPTPWGFGARALHPPDIFRDQASQRFSPFRGIFTHEQR